MLLKINGQNATHIHTEGRVCLDATPEYKKFVKEEILNALELDASDMGNITFLCKNVFNANEMEMLPFDDTTDLDEVINFIDKSPKEAEYDAGEQVFTITCNEQKAINKDLAIDVCSNSIWGICDTQIV